MKNKYSFFTKCLVIALFFITFLGCEEKSMEIPYYEFSLVSKYKKESIVAFMDYNSDNRLSEFNIYVNESSIGRSPVKYTSSYISCTINDVMYHIQLSNTRGGIRAESVRVSTLEGVRLYYIEYWYDDAGRVNKARLDGIDIMPIWNHYKYEGNTIIIDDAGTEYRLELSSEENLGYVCNVLDYANAPITSNYIFNPYLYFLKIYGTPVNMLPSGQEIVHCNNNKNLSRVGKHYYEY